MRQGHDLVGLKALAIGTLELDQQGPATAP